MNRQIILTLLVVFTSSLIEQGFVSFSLLLPLVLAVSICFPPEESFILAFSAGLVASLVGGTMLGRESLALLTASGIVHLYARRFSERHLIFAVLFSSLGAIGYFLIAGRQFNLLVLLAELVFTILILTVVRWWKEKYADREIVLKL